MCFAPFEFELMMANLCIDSGGSARSHFRKPDRLLWLSEKNSDCQPVPDDPSVFKLCILHLFTVKNRAKNCRAIQKKIAARLPRRNTRPSDFHLFDSQFIIPQNGSY